MSKSGIYAILNKSTGKYYIGSSVNLAKRKREHLWALNNNKHPNPYLQNAYNKYGKDNYTFIVLELVEDRDRLLEVEQHYMDSMNACDRATGYNINELAGGGGLFGGHNPNFGKRMPDEVRRKISNTLKGHPVSDETRAKMSKNRKGKCVGPDNWNYGREVSQERRDRQSKALKGRFMGENNPWYGKKHSEETRKKMSRAKMGKTGENCPNSIKVAQLTLDGEFVCEYPSMLEAERQTGIWGSNIQKCCAGQLKTSGGYRWMYFEDYSLKTNTK